MSPSSVPLAGLIVLDGWGLNPRPDGNAIQMARTPVMDTLMRDCPHATLVTWGESVGLPPGQMGNSEVGHLDRKSTRLNSSHVRISYAVFCLKKKIHMLDAYSPRQR